MENKYHNLFAVWLFLLIILDATYNADNDNLAMCKID